MTPLVNLEETPGKVVGRPAVEHDLLARQGEMLLRRLPFPRGVFRFRTHEEADAWMEHHILQAALKKARARPVAPT
jgi:hypothetical protein